MGLLEEIIFYDVTALLSTLTWKRSDFCLEAFLLYILAYAQGIWISQSK